MSDNANTGIEKVVIIGSGPAGWTAAIYAARANLDPVVYVGVAKQDPSLVLPGGQLMLTTEVENYPGFPGGIAGPEMMSKFQDQAESFGTRTVDQDIVEVDFKSTPMTIKSSSGDTIRAHTIIVATGATANWLNLESEQRLARNGGGVSACAVCDGALPAYRDQHVVVIGGGDTALEEATYLTKFASKVTIIHRRDALRGSKIMQERFMSKPNAEVLWNKVVTDVLADEKDRIRAVELEDTITGEKSELAVKGMFVAIGHTPTTKFLSDSGLDFDSKGYIVLPTRKSHTNLDGVFAAGDVADADYRQAVTAAGMGCQAAIDAEHWLGDKDLA